MAAVLDMLPKIKPKMVNLGLAISTGIILIILIICFSTFGWVVDWNSCDFSLEEAKCSGATSDLSGDAKDAADAMIGLGAMTWVFLFVNLGINLVIMLEMFTNTYKILTLVALGMCGLSWLFLMAGWGNYAHKKGGTPTGDVHYGASFAFVIITWLALFPYTFFWGILWNQINDQDIGEPVADDNEPSEESSAPATGSAPVYTHDTSTANTGSAPVCTHDTSTKTSVEAAAPAVPAPVVVQEDAPVAPAVPAPVVIPENPAPAGVQEDDPAPVVVAPVVIPENPAPAGVQEDDPAPVAVAPDVIPENPAPAGAQEDDPAPVAVAPDAIPEDPAN